MTPHKNNNNPSHHCIHEARIVKIEQKLKQTLKQQDEHDRLLKELNANIQKLSEIMISTQATFNTLKWIIGALIGLFGGFFVFLLSELTKLI